MPLSDHERAMIKTAGEAIGRRLGPFTQDQLELIQRAFASRPPIVITIPEPKPTSKTTRSLGMTDGTKINDAKT